MNDRKVDKPPATNRPSSSLKRSKVGGIALVVLAALYTVLQPTLNERFGLNLPSLRTESSSEASVVEAAPNQSGASPSNHRVEKPGGGPQTSRSNQSNSENDLGNDQPVSQFGAPGAPESASAATHTSPAPSKTATKPPPPSGRGSQSPVTAKTPPNTGSVDRSAPEEDLLYGLLRQTSPDRYLSPAGLQYNPGSQEGHRLEHLRRHTKDDRSRPIHGVFDGDMEGALKTIDKAYQRAKQGQRTTKKMDGRRTIYTVDMGGRIGFVGGKEGARRRNPLARRVRIVLEGNQVITAFPQ
jgi:hypothetical protein